MQFVTLASSSKGNAGCVIGRDGAWLVDCGISKKAVETGLTAAPGALDALRGILISHEHADHVRGLGPFLRRHPLPCYASRGTLRALLDGRLGKVDAGLFHELPADGLTLDDWHIDRLDLSHDAAEPTGFVFHENGSKLAMLTDTGELDDHLLDAIADSDLLYIEANHDPDMLRNGPYPAMLKRRIASSLGHLSNAQCAAALRQILSPRTRQVVLAHLSQHNNTPQEATRAVRCGIQKDGSLPEGTCLSVAAPQGVGIYDLANQ